MSGTAEQDCECLICDVSVDALPIERSSTQRCLDCQLHGRSASWRLRFDLDGVAHRTDWCESFRVMESLREFYDSEGIGSNHRLERRIHRGDSQ